MTRFGLFSRQAKDIELMGREISYKGLFARFIQADGLKPRSKAEALDDSMNFLEEFCQEHCANTIFDFKMWSVDAKQGYSTSGYVVFGKAYWLAGV